MQTIRGTTTPTESADGTDKARSGPGEDLAALLAGAATAVGGFGAVLALADSDSPLRGPLTLFFLLAAPAAAVAAALRGLEPFGRTIAALAGSVVVNMLVAQAMLALHIWSTRGGILAVTAISCVLLLLVLLRRPRRSRTTTRQGI